MQVSATTHGGRHMRLIISLIAVLLSGNAWSLDTAELIEHCERNDGQGNGYCIGYYSGVVNATTHTISTFKVGEVEVFDFYCVPENFTMGIGKKIWQRYVEENPETLTDIPFYTITLSLQDAYPCDN